MAIRAATTLLLAGIASSCVRHDAFRWNPETNSPREPRVAELDPARDCGRTKSGAPSAANNERCVDADGELFRLGFAEIDDQGLAWGEGQIDHTISFLDQAHDNGALVVVFVHGWRHDAAPDDGNVADFRRVLFGLAKGEREAGTGRSVRGLYVGWRAHPFRTTPVTTFWARKKGAHRVGERDAGRVLDLVAERVKSWRANERATLGAERSRALLVGHSFGAAVVHSALGRQLQGSLERDPAGERAYDLVALVNPAFEAARFRPLADAGHGGSQPAILMVTTEADCNTRKHFRWGMNGIRGEGVFRADQKSQRTTGAGHYAWPGRLEADAIECGNTTARDAVLGPEQVRFMGEQSVVGDEPPRLGARRRKDLCRYREHNHRTACRLASTAALRPVMVVYDTDSELMDHHSDVFTHALWTFLWSIADRVTEPEPMPTSTGP